MELIPAKFEYLFLLALYATILLALLDNVASVLARDRAFWFSFLIFEILWVLFDLYGPNRGLWIFSANKLCGILLVGVPVEEHLVFLLMHTTAVGTWLRIGAPRDLA